MPVAQPTGCLAKIPWITWTLCSAVDVRRRGYPDMRDRTGFPANHVHQATRDCEWTVHAYTRGPWPTLWPS